MSPVAKRRGRAHTGRAVSVAAVGVVVALGAAFGVATLASRGDVEVRLGDDRFDAGSAENLSDIIDRDGQPVLFPDVANFVRAVYIDHAGDDPQTGWVALGAFVPDQVRCGVLFDPEADGYVVQPGDGCAEGAVFPRSGAGMRIYATEVVDGRLFVNLQDAAAE